MREWERWSRWPADDFMTAGGIGIDNRVRQKIVNVIGLLEPKERKILDVGCGPGIDYCRLAVRYGQEFEYVGIDITPSMLYVARSRASLFGLKNFEFAVQDLFCLPTERFSSGCFNVVICKDVLDHLPPESVSKDYNYKSALRRLVDMGSRDLIIGFYMGLDRVETKCELCKDGFWRNEYAAADIYDILDVDANYSIMEFPTKTIAARTAMVLWVRRGR